MKLRYKIIIYLLGIFTGIISPIIKWSILAFPFGKKVDIPTTIAVLASKEGVVLKDFIRPSQQMNLIESVSKNEPVLVISQEYPSSQGFSYQQRINLNNSPAVMTFQNDWQPFWLGLNNVNKKIENLKNPILFLDFHGSIQVKVAKESLGWVETDPNFTYFYKTEGSIQPGQGARFNPLFVKFLKDGVYNIAYSVTSDNEIPVSGGFSIRVVE